MLALRYILSQTHILNTSGGMRKRWIGRAVYSEVVVMPLGADARPMQMKFAKPSSGVGSLTWVVGLAWMCLSLQFA